MEYLVDMVTTGPKGPVLSKLMNYVRMKQCELQSSPKKDHLIRLWRPPLGPDEWRSIGLFRAEDEIEIHKLLGSLPLHIWMKVAIAPLTPHPNDPQYRSSQAKDHSQT